LCENYDLLSCGRWLYGKLVSTFRAFGVFAVNRRWTSGTGKNSAVAYVKGETAFWTPNHTFRPLLHQLALSPSKTRCKVLKTLLVEVTYENLNSLEYVNITQIYRLS